MLSFLLTRLLSSLWTLILVVVVSFFLIQLAPGDKAEAILNLQGITIGDDENSNYYQEYEALRVSMNLNAPWFYFSLSTSYKDHLNLKNWQGRHRQLADQLSKYKISRNEVEGYVNALLSVDTYCQENNLDQCNRQVRFLYETVERNQIDYRLKELSEISNSPELVSLVNELKSLRKGLDRRVGIYYPVIRWNGLNNQFHDRLMNIFRLDFGNSVLDGTPVTTKISSAIGWTILLTISTLILSIFFGIPLSIISVRSNKWIQSIIGIFMNVVYAMPVFWLATLMILFFTTPEYGKWSDIFPSPMFRPGNDDFWSSIFNNGAKLILPVLCLAISSLPVIVRITRRSIITESIEPYITALRAKGLKEKDIYRRHIIPNALIPVVTLISNSIPSAMAGTLVIEVIFNIPGMGRLMYESISNFDWDVCFAIIIMMSVVTSLVFMIADIIYYLINPTMKAT